MPAAQTQPATRSAVFDEQGNTIDASAENELQEVPETEAEVAEEPDAVAAEPGKYKIGDKEFATLEEAHAYATSKVATLEQEQLIADAHRQGMAEALQHLPQNQNVTQSAQPEKPAIDEEKLWANPSAFLAEYAEKIQAQTLSQFEQRSALRESGNRVWNEFTARHPALADFRNEAETFVDQNADTLKAIRATKGQAAAYDYIALKLKENFARYATAMKPQKQLPNGTANASPGQAGGNVTRKPAPKKPLSLKEQLRSLKKKR